MSSFTKGLVGIIVLILVIVGLSFWASKSGQKPTEPVVPPAPTGPIKIGFIGPLTGDAANIGQNSKAAVEIAVEEVNASGGVNGRPLEVIYEDGQCNGKAAASAASKLIDIDKVPVILGGACSGETSSFTGLAEQAKTVVLSYCASAPALTQAGDYIFRNVPSDNFQGVFVADYIFNKLQKTKVVVLYVQSDYGVGIKDVFVTKFKELGGTIVAEEGYEQVSRDLRSQLTKIKAAKPQLLYFIGYTEASIPGLKQAAELKLNLPIFGSDAWDDNKIWTEVGAVGEGVMYSIPFSPLSDEFKAKMKAKLGSDTLTICSPNAYDGVKLLAGAMAQVGTDATAIKDAFYRASYTGGVSSPEIRFDQNGDLVGANYVVKVVKNSKAEVLP